MVSDFLQRLLEEGHLRSQFEEYLTELRSSPSFYTKTLERDGVEAAEAQLQGWKRGRQMRVFAESIEPIARGLMALAKVATEREAVTIGIANITDDTPYPRAYDISNPSAMVVLLNPQLPGCACTQPPEANIFGPWGALHLKAITLQVGRNQQGRIDAQLGLVLPLWGTNEEAPAPNDFSVVTMQRNGSDMGHVFYKPPFTSSDLMRHLLGQTDLPRASFVNGMGGLDMIGFPGAGEYLASVLPNLGAYLEAAAVQLSTDHKH